MRAPAWQDQSYCAKNGWKQQLRCLETRAGENVSYLDAETTSYFTFQPCPLTFNSFVRFEAAMFLCFLFSFYYVQRRKRRLQAIAQYRIASY